MHRYGDFDRPLRESYFPVIWADPHEISFDGFTAEERSVIRAFTWCTRDELDATCDTVWPSDLGAIWDHWLGTEVVGAGSGLAGEPLTLHGRIDYVGPGGPRPCALGASAVLTHRPID